MGRRRAVRGPGSLGRACCLGAYLLGLAAGCGGTGADGGEVHDAATMVRLGPAPSTTEPVTAAPTTTLPSTTSSDPAGPEADTENAGEAAATTTPTTIPSVRSPFTAARPVGDHLATYRSPDDAEVWWRLDHPGPYDGDRTLLVLEDHGDWLLVDLPVRPNGTTGWVRRADVSLSSHDAVVHVDLSERRLWAWEDGHLVAEGAVAVGAEDTPTPTGRFAVNHVEEQADPDTLFGAWIVGTSGFSDVLDLVDGGDPAVAIHGTNDPSVLGDAVSLGCIRVHDEVVARLARLPLGTPVEIRA